ncbi:MAG: sigma-70 family RNA polymerase sigma factor [Planctomycetota bacterium]
MSQRPRTTGDTSAATSGPKAQEASDSLLIERGAKGDGEAFDELMRRYHERVYSTVTRMVRDADLALDLTQETFIRAWRGLEGYQGQAGFFTWVYRIARNVVLSDQRRVMARPKVSLSLSTAFSAEDSSSIDVEDKSHDPARDALNKERQGQLIQALQSLISDFREIILLRDIEQRPYEEIAELLEIPVGTVRSRLHRARLELRSTLARISGEQEAERS